MAKLGGTFDASSVEPNAPLEALPAGEYKVQILQSEMRVVDNGYPVLPIMPGTKKPGQFKRGAWRDYPGWTRHGARPTSEHELIVWSGWPDAGIGIPTGTVIGIDIDIRETQLATRLEQLAREMLGDTPAVRFGMQPKRLLVYRTPDPLSGMKAHPIEVLDAERRRKRDVVVQMIFDEAAAGRMYTGRQFAERFENKAGLGAERTIRDRISVLATKGWIKFVRNYNEYDLPAPERSKFGYLCVEDMVLGPIKEIVDGDTGEVAELGKPVRPSDYKCPQTGALLPVENPNDWVYQEDDPR